MSVLKCVVVSFLVLAFGDVASAGGFDKKMTINVTVTDADGPVHGATVRAGFKRRLGIESSVTRIELTDFNGEAAVSSETSGHGAITVKKDGYYEHYEKFEVMDAILKSSVNTNAAVRLKKVIDPIPMYVKGVRAKMPAAADDEPVGYDLEKGDWVAPHGKGTQQDLRFRNSLEVVDKYNYTARTVITFPGEYNGIQVMHSEYSKFEGAQLKSDHLAPETGYESFISFENGRKGGKYFGRKLDVAGYYFRVRAEVNKKGEIESAQFGKIYGKFGLSRFADSKASCVFTYYFNPDKTRNVEFDPKKNLFLKHEKRGQSAFFVIPQYLSPISLNKEKGSEKGSVRFFRHSAIFAPNLTK